MTTAYHQYLNVIAPKKETEAYPETIITIHSTNSHRRLRRQEICVFPLHKPSWNDFKAQLDI